MRKSGNGFIDKESKIRKYRFICKDCDECNKRMFCTNSKRGREIKISENFNEILSFREKCSSKLGRIVLRKRKETVEHPFGTLKWNWGYRYFIQIGLEKVQSEFSFMTFIYNFKRVLNLVSIDDFMKAIEAVGS